mmetsp:Transcript_25373/g.33120  ORF Transcript_25373/g.33120 Transcript_25373/m.33120 type:complete len:269 (-) Transcript_25373:188-994(-)
MMDKTDENQNLDDPFQPLNQIAEVSIDGDRSNDLVISILAACEDLQALQQEINKGMRKGFLQITRARQASGIGQISALNCRSEFPPFLTVDMNEDALQPSIRTRDLKPSAEAEPAVSAYTGKTRATYSVGELWHLHQNVSTSKSPITCGKSDASAGLRRRNRAQEGQTGMTVGPMDVGESVNKIQIKDPLQLFGALVPQPLRKAKIDFKSVLDHAVFAANKIHQIKTLLKDLENEQRANVSVVQNQNNKTRDPLSSSEIALEFQDERK